MHGVECGRERSKVGTSCHSDGGHRIQCLVMSLEATALTDTEVQVKGIASGNPGGIGG